MCFRKEDGADFRGMTKGETRLDRRAVVDGFVLNGHLANNESMDAAL